MTLPAAIGPFPVVRLLRAGGQGTVYLVRSKERQRAVDEAFEQLVRGLHKSSAQALGRSERKEAARDVAEGLSSYLRPDSPDELFAAKVYNMRQDSGDAMAQTMARLQIEFEVLGQLNSSHIVRVIHTDIGSKLMMMEYYPDGNLADHPQRYYGDALRALQALRGVVDAVAQLHARGI